VKLFDPHIHMSARTTDDYQTMSRAGIATIVEPASWLGQPRTTVGSFEDYFALLVGWERFRAAQFGIQHYSALGLNPREANDRRLAREVMQRLPAWLEKESVVAVGAIGYDDVTPLEDAVFAEHLELAKRHDLPVVVHTPLRDKRRGTERALAVVRELRFAEQCVLIDHSSEETLPLILDSGCWAGHSLYPDTKLDERRMAALVLRYGAERILVNSAADWGISDPLKVPKCRLVMRAAGVSEGMLRAVFWENPVAFFSQSRRLQLELAEPVNTPVTREVPSTLRGAL